MPAFKPTPKPVIRPGGKPKPKPRPIGRRTPPKPGQVGIEPMYKISTSKKRGM